MRFGVRDSKLFSLRDARERSCRGLLTYRKSGMRDFFEKCLVFGAIGLAFWLLTFDRHSPKQRRHDDARQSAWEDERGRNDAAADAAPQTQNRHNHHR
jgi:hypothetical protein